MGYNDNMSKDKIVRSYFDKKGQLYNTITISELFKRKNDFIDKDNIIFYDSVDKSDEIITLGNLCQIVTLANRFLLQFNYGDLPEPEVLYYFNPDINLYYTINKSRNFEEENAIHKDKMNKLLTDFLQDFTKQQDELDHMFNDRLAHYLQSYVKVSDLCDNPELWTLETKFYYPLTHDYHIDFDHPYGKLTSANYIAYSNNNPSEVIIIDNPNTHIPNQAALLIFQFKGKYTRVQVYADSQIGYVTNKDEPFCSSDYFFEVSNKKLNMYNMAKKFAEEMNDELKRIY